MKCSNFFNFVQNLNNNNQVWSKFQKSSISNKIWKIFNFGQIFKNLQFLPKLEKSSIFTKIWKIFKFWQNFQKSSIFTKISKIFNFDQYLKNLQFWPNFQNSSILKGFVWCSHEATLCYIILLNFFSSKLSKNIYSKYNSIYLVKNKLCQFIFSSDYRKL